MPSIEERLGQAERVGEQVNRVIDIWEPRIGAVVRILRKLIDRARGRGEDVRELELELADLDAEIASTQGVVDEFKRIRAGEREAAAVPGGPVPPGLPPSAADRDAARAAARQGAAPAPAAPPAPNAGAADRDAQRAAARSKDPGRA